MTATKQTAGATPRLRPASPAPSASGKMAADISHYEGAATRVPARRISRSSHPGEQLQQTIGNQAMQRLASSGRLQAKLRVGPPNDIYELEADRLTDQVMQCGYSVQRQCAACSSGKKCPNCEENEPQKLRRKAEAPRTVDS